MDSRKGGPLLSRSHAGRSLGLPASLWRQTPLCKAAGFSAPTVLALQCAPRYEALGALLFAHWLHFESRNKAVRVWGGLSLSSLPDHPSPCPSGPLLFGQAATLPGPVSFRSFSPSFSFACLQLTWRDLGCGSQASAPRGQRKSSGYVRAAGQGQTLGAVLLLTPQPLAARTTHTYTSSKSCHLRRGFL